MKTKQVIQISSYYPPHLGGQENAVHDLAVQLAATYHVQVITSSLGGGPNGNSFEEGVRVKRLRAFVFGHAPIMLGFPAALYRIAQATSIVHIHIGQAFTPEMVWLIAKLRGFPYIAQLHIDFEPSGPAGILLPLYKRLILKRVLKSAAAVITLNDKTLRTVRETYSYTGKSVVLNNGIDERYFRLKRTPLATTPPQTLRLLFVGRFSKQKNIIALLNALATTQRAVHLDLIGEGPEQETIARTIAEHKLTTVTVHGRLERAEVMQFYATCDALVMPSLYEAQPLVLLEAMAARIPIIGTNVIGVADHLKDGGIIVEPTAEGLAGGIEQYYIHYAAVPAMVDRAYRKAEGLRWKHTLKKYEELYEDVVGN